MGSVEEGIDDADDVQVEDIFDEDDGSSGSFDQFIRLLTPELCKNDTKIYDMKRNLIQWKIWHDKIAQIIFYMTDLSNDSTFDELMSHFSMRELGLIRNKTSIGYY